MSKKSSRPAIISEIPDKAGAESSKITPVKHGPRLLIGLVCLILLSAIVGAMVLLLTSSLSSNSTDPTAASASKSDLSYPGATSINFDEKDIWPEGRPAASKDSQIGMLVTKDNYAKVADYYKQKLSALGFTLTGPAGAITCKSGDCPNSQSISASNATSQIIIAVIAGGDLGQVNNFPEKWQKFAANDQTLITYQLNPVITAPNATQAETSVTASAIPTRPLPATPVQAGDSVYLGPDNRFHSGGGLVITTPPASQTLNGNINFHIDWLVADQTGTAVKITTVSSGSGDSNGIYNSNGGRVGSLLDENGHAYELSRGEWETSGDVNRTYQSVIWHTAPIPASARRLTFRSGPGMSLKPAPIILNLTGFDEAKLPQLKANPTAFSDLNGVKVSLPYAYFGPDRTVLLVNLRNTSGNGYIMQSLGPPFSYGSASNDSLAVLDDKNQMLNPLPQRTGGATPASGQPTLPLNIETNGDLILLLEPVRPGTTKLHLKLARLGVTLTPAYTANMPNFAVPLAELLKTGASQTGPNLEIQGIKFQVVSEQAILDSNKKQLDLLIKLAPTGSGANIINNLTMSCMDCGAVGIIGSSRPPNDGQPFDFDFKLNYEPNRSSITAQIDKLSINLAGPWQLDIAVNPSKPSALNAVTGSSTPCLSKNLSLDTRTISSPSGQSYRAVYFVNQGTNSCTLVGFPLLKVVNEQGQPEKDIKIYQIPFGPMDQLPANFGNNPKGVVTLQTGQAAVAEFRLQRCDTGRTSVKIEYQLDLPGEGGTVTIPLPTTGHCNDPVGSAGISTFYPAPDNWRNQ